MKRLWTIIINLLLLTAPALVWAADPGEKMVDMGTRQVATAGLSAINLFFAGWYNDNKWVFAIIVTVLMGLVGGIIAFITDIFLKAAGLDVSKMDHHE
ncbi:MAG: hypothetical protein FJ121_03795 [Deltaproteobacteria bacterium]|nr:hypothetical protein [Deltaproteobacteria bacterium]